MKVTSTLSVVLFALLSFTIHSASVESLDGLGLWNIFKNLDPNGMRAFALSHRQILRDKNVRTLLECRGNYACAYMRIQNPQFLTKVHPSLQKSLMRRIAMDDKRETVKQMIKLGVDPQWLDYPLKRALRLGLSEQAEWIRKLLPRNMKGIKVAEVDTRIDPQLLFDALRDGRMDEAQQLIDDGVDVNAQFELGTTLLTMIPHHPGINSHVQMVNMLIDAGADVNAQDMGGNTPLIEAASASDFNVIAQLIDAGANLNAKNEEGRTAVVEASKQGMDLNRGMIISLLIDAGSDLNVHGDKASMETLSQLNSQFVELMNGE